MSSNVCRRVFAVAIACTMAAFVASPAASQMSQNSPGAAADSQSQAALYRILAGLFSDTSSHMRMGPTRTATAADSERAAEIVRTARAALSQYTDVKAAERDGYYRNMPRVQEQPIYHYNNQAHFNAAFDITKPVSLLYKKDEQGQLKLVGAMYGTSDSATPEQLDALLPTSMAHWHEHVNLCYPGRLGNGGLSQIDAGKVFMLNLFFSITKASECESAGGQFVPVDFGWMAHVYLFAGSDDPKVIWDTDDAGNMDVRMRHHS